MRIFCTLLALALAAPAAAQSSDGAALSLDQRMLVRCSTVFAMVAAQQEQGFEGAGRYPAMGERGRDFFVRASAQVMDEAGLTIEQLDALMREEAEEIVAGDQLETMMPICLTLLPVEQ